MLFLALLFTARPAPSNWRKDSIAVCTFLLQLLLNDGQLLDLVSLSKSPHLPHPDLLITLPKNSMLIIQPVYSLWSSKKNWDPLDSRTAFAILSASQDRRDLVWNSSPQTDIRTTSTVPCGSPPWPAIRDYSVKLQSIIIRSSLWLSITFSRFPSWRL
jgi:hypothetical protein